MRGKIFITAMIAASLAVPALAAPPAGSGSYSGGLSGAPDLSLEDSCKGGKLDASFSFSNGALNGGQARVSGTCGGSPLNFTFQPSGGLERGAQNGSEFIAEFTDGQNNADLTIIGEAAGGKASGSAALSFEGKVYELGKFSGSRK